MKDEDDRIIFSRNDETGDMAIEGGTASIAPDGPFKLQVQFGIINEADDMHGYATADFPPGKVPTDAEISKLAIAVLGMLPDGFRFMQRKEFIQELVAEHTGIDVAFAVPEASIQFRLDAFKVQG